VKGSGIGSLVYRYNWVNKKGVGRAYNDLRNRCTGNRVLVTLHELNILSTRLGDEDTYACNIGTVQDSAKLIVNGEYYSKNIEIVVSL